MDKTQRQLGNIVIDFVNAKNTDEACFKHFENMQNLMAFADDFADRVKARFPSLDKINSLTDNEKQSIHLLLKLRQCEKNLRHELEAISYELDGFNYENKTVNLLSFYCEGGAFVEGEPDVTVDYTNLPTMGLDEFKKELSEDLGRALKSEYFERVDMAFELGDTLLKLKKGMPDSRFKELSKLSESSGRYHHYEFIDLHKKLLDLQNRIRDTLRQIVQGQHYREIVELPRLVNLYNNQKRSTLKIRVNSLLKTPLIPSISYLSITSLHHWHSQIYDDLAYCLLEFLETRGNRDFIRICKECKEFFLMRRQDNQIFCNSKCRLAYHNRENIKSGKSREYKRAKRKEGAKESYYG
jgi:hypothetical protein